MPTSFAGGSDFESKSGSKVVVVKLGRKGRKAMRRVTLTEVERNLYETTGRRSHVYAVVGFAHLLPRSKRRGKPFIAKARNAQKRRGKAR